MTHCPTSVQPTPTRRILTRRGLLSPLVRAALCLLLAAVWPTAALPAEVDLGADARLAAKVSLQYPSATLETVLQDVARATGVSISAGRDSGDWLSREYPVTVLVREAPAAEVLKQLGLLTGLHWSVSGEGDARSYRLWEDERARQARVEARERQAREQEAQEREAALENLRSLASLGRASQKEIEEIAAKNPSSASLLGQRSVLAAARIIAALSPDQLERATTSEGLRLPYAQLPPALQAQVRDYITGTFEMMRQFSRRAPVGGGAAPTPELPSPEELMKTMVPELEKSEVVIANTSDMPGSRLASRLGMTGTMSISNPDGDAPGMGFALFNPLSPAGQMFGGMIGAMMEGAPEANLMVAMDREMMGLLDAGLGEGARETPTDPELTKKVSLKLEETEGSPGPVAGPLSLGKVLEALHEATGLNVIADDLPRTDEGLPVASLAEEAPVYKTLYRLSVIFGTEWRKEGSLLCLWDREWARKVSALIPRAQLDRWTAAVETPEGLKVGHLIEMASLTEDQVRITLWANPALMVTSLTLTEENRAMLRLLASLTPAQTSQLEGGKLPLSALSPEQWQMALEAWQATSASPLHSIRGAKPPQVPLTRLGDLSMPQPSGRESQEPLPARSMALVRLTTGPGADPNAPPASRSFLLTAGSGRPNPPPKTDPQPAPG